MTRFWLAGSLADANVVMQFALVLMLQCLVLTILGLTISVALAFPLLFLLFAVPFGEAFVPRLMDWTADFTVLGLKLTGVPVYREGNNFVIPSGHWSVVEACSGSPPFLFGGIFRQTSNAFFASLAPPR